MKIHPLQTGTVRVKDSFLDPSPGRRRQLDLFLPGPWSEPLPIHCWAIEHDGTLLLVDSGETASVRDVPFARFDDAGRHVMLAGDVTDTLEQLHARRADAVGPDPAVHVATLETMLVHCAEHPTIYLPSHDPESAARLHDSTLVNHAG